MARIPSAEIERLKSEIAVERLVESGGVALKRAGKDLLGRCPFHEDFCSVQGFLALPTASYWKSYREFRNVWAGWHQPARPFC